MKVRLLIGAGLLALAGCSPSGTSTTTLDRGDRLAPDSAGKCTQMVGTQQYKVKCPDQK